MRAFFKIVSMREVAVTMWDEPAVRDVKRYKALSCSHERMSDILSVITEA